MPYTIIIPIHNEKANIQTLLEGLNLYSLEHEVLIIDDGSIDGSFELLSNCPFIKLERIKQNSGKGTAIRRGLDDAAFDKVIIFDGDMELDPAEISKLMILDNNSGLVCVFGSRYENIKPFASLWNFGNFFFTGLFNMVHGSQHTDALCCAKSFYRSYISIEKLQSTGFDIDVELAVTLKKKNIEIKTVYLGYTRRSEDEGKKLRFSDGWTILKRILNH